MYHCNTEYVHADLFRLSSHQLEVLNLASHQLEPSRIH